jgi:hypothetical protein
LHWPDCTGSLFQPERPKACKIKTISIKKRAKALDECGGPFFNAVLPENQLAQKNRPLKRFF